MRPLRPNEVDKLIVLWKEFLNDQSAIDGLIPTNEENIRRMLEFVNKLVAEDPRQVLVAQEEENLIGYLMFQRQSKTTPLQTSRSWAYISDLYVVPNQRRRGVGRSLLKACLDDLRSSGVSHVRLSVWLENHNAMRLYEQVGFKDYMHIMEAELEKKETPSRPHS